MDFELPAILDPVFTYLAEYLPSPLYSLLINVLSHCLALISSFIKLLTLLLARTPLEWDAHAVLPPLISFLAAYLALVGLYRTTSWMIRTSFWFMKWGIVLGTLVAGIGWYIGVTQAQVVGMANAGFVSHVSNLALATVKGPAWWAPGDEREGHVRHLRFHNKFTKSRVAFERHRGRRYSDQLAEKETLDIEKFFENLMSMAGRIVGDDAWWMRVKHTTDGVGGRDFTEESGSVKGRASGKSRTR